MQLLNWSRFCLENQIPQPVMLKWNNIISSKYAEPQRHYHTLQHINRMITLLDQSHRPDYVSIYLSIIFHDIVYDPKRTDNEIQSVEQFRQFCAEIELDLSVTEQVITNIQATIKHQPINPNSQFFLDLDLEILSANTQDYSEYASNIRKEYHFVEDFNEKRIAVLNTFLTRERIFFTKEYHERINGISKEEQARFNLAKEIGLLSENLN